MMPPDVISHENQLQHLSEPSIFMLDVFRTADHAVQIFIPHRLGYLPQDAPSIEQICSKADKALFASVCHNPDRVLSHLLPPKKESVHALRPRVHDRVLPEADDRMRRTFLTRMLYSDYSCL